MINVHISPDYLDKVDTGDGGIRRVSEAMIKHLPKFGVEHVRNIADAHIIANHGAMLTRRKGIPIVNINHGLYWSRYPWGDNFQQVNEAVVESMRWSVAHTVPSEWVARAVRRGGFFYPEVVYHGIDAEDFPPLDKNEGYVLWNKARADYVSDPIDVSRVARLMRSQQFVTTIGARDQDNVDVIGITDYERMKQIVGLAGVYLCTTRETFGIGTLEALARGVPVAGWDWGGQHEIVVQGETGYLAAPGNYQQLADCIAKCLGERARLSANAVEDARTRWRWEPRIEQYANIFKRVYDEYYVTKRPKVSVIVTAYNLDRYLLQCLDSVKRQTFGDLECIVVDDALSETTMRIVEDYRLHDSRFRYVRPPENLGLPGARNFGFKQARGRYIRYLDADDFLAENAINIEASALDADCSLHIAYGHMEVVREDGSRTFDRAGNPERSGWPPLQFNWIWQMAHLNHIPSCCMMRREVMERSGGYRVRMKRNEDAEFWCRVTSLGFRAFKVTQAVMEFHRLREDSKGAIEWRDHGGEPDWTAWFPWRVGATDLRSAERILKKNAGRHPHPHLVPFGAQGRPSESIEGNHPFWYVHDYAYPVVSIIVTCGPGHEATLIDALDSIQAQTFPDWECVVVNDTGTPWGPNIAGAPWAKVVNMQGNRGVAEARNEGYRHTRGRYIIWLDADDYWFPWYLDVMVSHAEMNDGVICSDLIKDENGKLSVYRYADFDQNRVVQGMQYPGSSILTPRKVTEAVRAAQGGFDPNIPGMEDWDYQFCVHALGFCAYHVAEPLFVYRTHTSTKRERDYAKIDSIREYMDQKWSVYRKGEKRIMCGCAPQKRSVNVPNSTLSSSGSFAPQQGVNQGDLATQMVQVEYVGPLEETFTIRSRVDRTIMYRFGNNASYRQRAVFLADAEFLAGLVDANGIPLYRQLTHTAMLEQRDPSAFLGQPVLA